MVVQSPRGRRALARRRCGRARRQSIARIAGEVLGELRLGREHTIDAIVMASAAQRGDIVYTSDFDDMTRLATRFPGLRVLSV
jgi:hypothetical protein